MLHYVNAQLWYITLDYLAFYWLFLYGFLTFVFFNIACFFWVSFFTSFVHSFCVFLWVLFLFILFLPSFLSFFHYFCLLVVLSVFLSFFLFFFLSFLLSFFLSLSRSRFWAQGRISALLPSFLVSLLFASLDF